MEAFTFIKPGELNIVDIPDPEMGPEDILIDIHYIGLCGSDLNTYRGLMPFITYPRIPGHELSGIIISKGEKVPSYFAEGKKVMISPYTHCGLCPACRIGRTNCCEFNQTLGIQRDGALTSQIAIHYSKVFSSQTLSLKELVLIEPLSVGYHTANRGQVSEVDMVLVLGCGTIGMGVILAAVRKGATVIALDIDDIKLKSARQFGADYVINSLKQDPSKVIAELTNHEGVNVAIEAAGIPETFRLAVEAVAYAGRVVFVGYTKKEVSFNTTNIVRKELNISGARNALHVFPAVIKMFEKREQPYMDLITRIYPFNETKQAFKDWAEAPGKFNKILIDLKV